MSEELKPCPFCGASEAHVRENEIGGYTVLCHNCTGEGPMHETEGNAAAEWNRRTAPVSAPLDTQALPPLPKPWRASYEESGHAEGGEFYMEAEIAELRGAILQRDERIRHLEREVAERKPASIGDDPKFRELVEWWAGAAHSSDKHTRTVRAKAEWAALIAYIDGRTAGTAPDTQEYFYTFSRPDGWINLLNPGQSWEEWTREQGAPTAKGWKVSGRAPTPMEQAK